MRLNSLMPLKSFRLRRLVRAALVVHTEKATVRTTGSSPCPPLPAPSGVPLLAREARPGPGAYWSCRCMGSAMCAGTLMNRSLRSRPTGRAGSFKSLFSCSTTLCSQFFAQPLRVSSLICSAHWVP